MPPHQLVARACGSAAMCAGRAAIVGDARAAALRAREVVSSPRALHHTPAQAHAVHAPAQCHAAGPRAVKSSAGPACVPVAWRQCPSAGHHAWVNPIVRAMCTRPGGGGNGGTHSNSAARVGKGSAAPHTFGPSPPSDLAAGDGSGAAEKEDDEEKERSRLAYVDSVTSSLRLCVIAFVNCHLTSHGFNLCSLLDCRLDAHWPGSFLVTLSCELTTKRATR